MLNIAKEIYVGWSTAPLSFSQPTILPDADVIPVGISASEIKKLNSFKSAHSVITKLDNIPLPGFTLHSSNKGSYSASEVAWLVIDPRGFLVKISSHNLEKILHVSGITEGLIQEECVWARNDESTKMELVPVCSPDYALAVNNTILIDAKLNPKDIGIGDRIRLQNGLVGRYMGVMSMYGALQNTIGFDHRPRSIIRKYVIEVKPGTFHFTGELKALTNESVSEVPLTQQDAIDYISAYNDTGRAYFTPNATFTSIYSCIFTKITSVAVPKIPMTFVEITADDAELTVKNSEASSDIGQVLLVNSNGMFLVNHASEYYSFLNYKTSYHTNEFDVIKIEEFDTTIPQYKLTTIGRRQLYLGSHGSDRAQAVTVKHFTKFYKIVKHIKNDTYV